MSAGIRSGVNWIRLKVQSMTSPMVRMSIVLPRPGTPSRSTWLLASSPTRVCRTSSLLADDDLADLGLDAMRAFGERLGRDAGGAGLGSDGCVHGSSGWRRGGGLVAHCLGSSELK